MATRLRVGVLLDGPWVSRWQFEAIEALRLGGDADLVVVVQPAAEGAPSGARRRREHFAWHLYNNKWVGRRCGAVDRVSIAAWEPDSGVVEVGTVRVGRFRTAINERGLATLKAFNLDVLVRFGFGILTGPILELPRLGVWSYHHDDERVIRGGPPSFWEVFDSLPTTGVLLQQLGEELDGGTPLLRWHFPTVRHSYPRNRHLVSMGSVEMLAVAARAARLGLLKPPSEPAAWAGELPPIRRNPSNATMLRFMLRQSVRNIRNAWGGLMKSDRWTVGLLGHAATPTSPLAPQSVHWLPELNRRGYLADPCAVPKTSGISLLAEDYDEVTGTGQISLLRSAGPQGPWEIHRGVLGVGTHASFPLAIEWEGEVFATAETWESGGVHLWRMTDDIGASWQYETCLVEDQALVDPTLFRHGDRWWLLATDRRRHPNAALVAWYTDELFGPWIAHPLNPIKVDVRSSRPAGAPFVADGKLIRPVQDCSTSYGSAVALMEVSQLDLEGFAETEATRVEPIPGTYGHGLHTLNRTADGWVVDGRRYGFSLHRARKELAGRLKRLR